MRDEFIKLEFVKTPSLKDLKREFESVPADQIKSVETEHNQNLERALLKEARVENNTSNLIKLVFMAYLLVQSAITIEWYFTPFTIGKIFSGVFLGMFIGFAAFVITVLLYVMTVSFCMPIIKFILFRKEDKFLEHLRNIKVHIDSQERYRKKQIETQANNSAIYDAELLKSHFSPKEHSPLFPKSKLENSVDEIFKRVCGWAIYDAIRKDKSDSYKNREIENHKRLLYLLAHVEDDEIVDRVNRYTQLTNLIDPNDSTSDFSKSLLLEISNIVDKHPEVLTYQIDAINRYSDFIKNFELELKTQAPKLHNKLA